MYTICISKNDNDLKEKGNGRKFSGIYYNLINH